jgi:two-component system OmpR family response regulator
MGDAMAKILVVDDESGIRNLLDTLLRRKDLELFRQERPDVIVLDLKMPEMDGLTVLRQIHSLDPRKPVIILTGAGTAEAKQQVRALGLTEYVEKEFSLHLLGDSLKRLLTRPFDVAGASMAREAATTSCKTSQ